MSIQQRDTTPDSWSSVVELVKQFGLKNETKQSTSLFLNKQIMKAGINFNINLNPLITQKIKKYI